MAEVAAAARRQILATGACGFIGRLRIACLREWGDAVIALSRQPTRAGVRCVGDLARLPQQTRIDAAVNLAGARNLGPPWTNARRQVLRESRLATRRAVVALCARLGKPSEVARSASAVGYSGVHGDEPLDETTTPQGIFQSRLYSDWEDLAGTMGAASRVILLRPGVVLGRVLHRRIWLCAPALLPRSMLGEMAQRQVDGPRALPQRALAAGFEFGHPRLEPALVNLLGPPCATGPKP